MKYLKLSAIVLVALFPGCADRATSTANAAANSTRSTSVPADTIVASDFESAKMEGNANAASNSSGVRANNPQSSVKNVIQKTTLAQAQVAHQAPTTTERKVVRNADLQLETESPEDAQSKITAIAEAKGGFVVESQQSTSDLQTKKRDTVTITVRVPADRFGDALGEIRSTADTVILENVKGEDVTEEFIDVEARLRTQKALEQQYIEIMKRASRVEDALYVQSELAEVRGEIEKIEGRKRYLENQSSLSTIKVKLQTPAAISASSSGFNSRLAESFGAGLYVALNFVLGLVTLVVGALPFALFVGLPGFLIVRHFWRKQNRTLSVTEIAKEEIRNE